MKFNFKKPSVLGWAIIRFKNLQQIHDRNMALRAEVASLRAQVSSLEQRVERLSEASSTEPPL